MTSPVLERIDHSALVRNPDRIRDVAPQLQRLLRIAYERVFEDQQAAHKLKRGAIREEFNEDDMEKAVKQANRMAEYIIKDGSIYIFSWTNDELGGVIKTSPSFPEKKAGDPNCFINDIAVVEEGRGTGSELLARGLEDYQLGQLAVADLYEGNLSANSWFRRRGFMPVSPQPGKLYKWIASVKISQYRVEAPSIRHVLESLSSEDAA